MKKFIGLIILMIAFIAFTGCTQQVVPEPVTTTPPTTVPTAVLTPKPTPVPTSVVTPLPPTVKRTESPTTKVVTTIYMRNNSFVPSELTALPGTGITWINDDGIVHSLKMSGSNNAGFNSGDIMPGASWSNTFGAGDGTFSISCIYHPDMKGTVIIKI
jgi:plastocyanin